MTVVALRKPIGPLEPGEAALQQVLLDSGVTWDFQHLREAMRKERMDCAALAMMLRAALHEFDRYASGDDMGIGERAYRFHVDLLRSAMDNWPLPLAAWDGWGTAEVWEAIEWSTIGTAVRQLRAQFTPAQTAPKAACRAATARSHAATFYDKGEQLAGDIARERAELWDVVRSLSEVRQPLREVRWLS
ncbi:hypothetical protein [Nocardia sp. NRRL S-836]|uniref:hypothetical protein n=1 Tax=Nocardia sp. NRRL S-836 TaxID=1519492 RepID=UPI0006AFE9B6|nr:hypothetical protein [Nocardia sp. NRRL S-836]KOV84667.1 hypothetical protein ADL03_15385 [Nocardia sp. NRRL S-836]